MWRTSAQAVPSLVAPSREVWPWDCRDLGLRRAHQARLMPDKLELFFLTPAAGWETSPSHRAEEGLPVMGSRTIVSIGVLGAVIHFAIGQIVLSPKSYVEAITPQCDCVWRQGLQEVIKVK